MENPTTKKRAKLYPKKKQKKYWIIHKEKDDGRENEKR